MSANRGDTGHRRWLETAAGTARTDRTPLGRNRQWLRIRRLVSATTQTVPGAADTDRLRHFVLRSGPVAAREPVDSTVGLLVKHECFAGGLEDFQITSPEHPD